MKTRVSYRHLIGREREVLQIVADGRMNREIAEKVHINNKTVESPTVRTSSPSSAFTRWPSWPSALCMRGLRHQNKFSLGSEQFM
jgi:hypothetical protein